jgi:pantothenate kinase
LSKLLTDYSNSEEAFKSGISGDNINIDMTVEDIYGDKLTNLGLSKDIIASSFGKAVSDTRKLKFSESDLMRSLITMIAINVGQMSWLYSEIERLKTSSLLAANWSVTSFISCFR